MKHFVNPSPLRRAGREQRALHRDAGPLSPGPVWTGADTCLYSASPRGCSCSSPVFTPPRGALTPAEVDTQASTPVCALLHHLRVRGTTCLCVSVPVCSHSSPAHSGSPHGVGVGKGHWPQGTSPRRPGLQSWAGAAPERVWGALVPRSLSNALTLPSPPPNPVPV